MAGTEDALLEISDYFPGQQQPIKIKYNYINNYLCNIFILLNILSWISWCLHDLNEWKWVEFDSISLIKFILELNPIIINEPNNTIIILVHGGSIP